MNSLAEEVIFAGPVAVEHPEDAQERRFSCAGRPHDGYKLAFFNVHADSAQDESLAGPRCESLFDVSQFNHWTEVVSSMALSSTTRPSNRRTVRSAWRAYRGSWVTMQIVAPS